MARYDLEPTAFDVAGMRFAIVAARFNRVIVEALLDGALQTFAEHGVGPADLEVVQVPGAFEVPLAALRLACTGRYDAIVTLGAVVRGDTPHFEYVAGECARGIARVTLDADIPVIFGVLTVDDMAQAEARIGGAHGHKGTEAALAALEMATLGRRLPRR
jgi:6,7-dimethyl-8-ribityllumazine synthase